MASMVDREITGSILDRPLLERMLAEYRGRAGVPPRGAALHPLGIHPAVGAPGQRRGHAEPPRVRAARGRIARPAGHLHVSRRRSRPTGCRVSTRSSARAGSAKDAYTHPTTMCGCNKLYCEQLGHYYARFYKQLAAESASGRGGFPLRAFPGLISAVTMPSGGTSDYAPEMIHAAAKGEPYAMLRAAGRAHPVHGDARRRRCAAAAGAAPRRALTRTAYNVAAFSPDRRRRARRRRACLPRRRRLMAGRREAPGHHRLLARRRRRQRRPARLGLLTPLRLRTGVRGD